MFLLIVDCSKHIKNESPEFSKPSIPLSTSSNPLETSSTEPAVEKGIATLEYEISNSGGDVCPGSLRGVFASFIRFDNSEKAQMSKSLLHGLGTGEFVYPLMVISKPNVWLVVQKIDSTLGQFKKKNTEIWSCYRLADKYKIIVRDLIAGVTQLVNLGYMGELKIQEIAIINGHAKLMRISNELGVSKLRDRLQKLLEDLLGNDCNNMELNDFYFHMKSMSMHKLIHLRDHPMLLTSQERLQFQELSLMSLNYERKKSDWRAKYDGLYKEQKVDIAKRVEKDPEYKKVFEYKILSNSASSQIIFSRNVIIHINDDRQCKTSEQVEKKLNDYFPQLLTRLYSFIIDEGIDVWDQHNEKYGGDLLSHWRATLKLCILENDDLATEHFLKICRSFLSLIEIYLYMRAEKCEAISSLLTMIKDQILTVESRYLQDQFKYRKLVWIFKDDNVSSTSTKLAENNCTNCINFLMRVLKFVAHLLRFYAQNPDGDVKRMFKTAYNSLLKDHPDLKSLQKHSNLIKSVPSNKQFKSLIGNPKNIDGCGITVAESLMILTDRWQKLSGSHQ